MRERSRTAGTPGPQDAVADMLRDAEDRALTAERTDSHSPYYGDPTDTPGGRRRFMFGSLAAVGAVASLPRLAQAKGSLGSEEHDVPADATKVPGYPLADESYGSRSQFETEVRVRFKTATPLSSWTFTPLQAGLGIVTPSGLHFERSHGGTAVIDPGKHNLFVHGMVRSPKK